MNAERAARDRRYGTGPLTFRGPRTMDGKESVAASEHRHAVALVPEVRENWAAAIGAMLCGWVAYAETHHLEYDSPIGEDAVLGPEWQAIGVALLGLLNGERGGLDGGTLAHHICATLVAEGSEAP